MGTLSQSASERASRSSNLVNLVQPYLTIRVVGYLVPESSRAIKSEIVTDKTHSIGYDDVQAS